MAVLKYGSSGEEVKKLQTALNSKGYTLDVDGSFGAKTLAAVKDYQTKNKLTADGMAGPETQGSLYGTAAKASAGSGGSDTSAISLAGLSANTKSNLTRLQGGYTPSQSVKDALEGYNKLKNEEEPSFESEYTKQLEELYERIINREPFRYDLNADTLYNQYKDSYVQQGRRAMEDAMGQAAALTGGYGSSYSQAAGQQQFDAYLQQLNNVIPELYSQAYDRFSAEGEELYSRYAAAGEGYRRDYDEYRDAVSDREKAVSAAYQKYMDQLTLDRDAYDEQLQYWLNAAKLENAEYWDTLSYIESQKSSSRGSSGGGSSRSSKKTSARTSDGTDGGKAYADRIDAYATGRLASGSKAKSGGGNNEITVSSSKTFLQRLLENLGIMY